MSPEDDITDTPQGSGVKLRSLLQQFNPGFKGRGGKGYVRTREGDAVGRTIVIYDDGP